MVPYKRAGFIGFFKLIQVAIKLIRFFIGNNITLNIVGNAITFRYDGLQNFSFRLFGRVF